eukprot:CAMPEP_0197826074 /NCGR_PEP_ID=MMETSP1437-20131217/3073_1 /TAXON_ID=49252 ORGANISM="Eucampia antarctica, Strain CCMP1452" /NCGR_SAMPLE_ID=MMETSP1437 /ASSEMBLY_ACC=CAM_ASM_001096 /LENGTH=506 /DNA_ID=CAMNT_0043426339 /DNA_START=154 /DNA_END=1674 /DNA_ORIENTATION=+
MTRYESHEDIPQATSSNGLGGVPDLTAKLIDKEDEAGADATPCTRGEVQERSCRDVIFALLFIAMVIGVAVVAGIKGFPALHEDKDNSKKKLTGVLYYALSTCAISIAFSGIALLVLNTFTEYIIVGSLLFSMAVSLGLAISCVFMGNIFGVVIGLLSFSLGLCYFCMIQNRIPFASANLKTGVAATKSNAGIFIVAYIFVAMSIVWIFIWMVALFGAFNGDKKCDANGNNCKYNINIGIMFLLFISIFWATQVFVNSVHVVVAGVIGTWWFAPDNAKSCCSEAVQGSLFRTLTTSFGSVCFGSLVVSIIQALKAIVESLRNNSGNDAADNCCLCCFECILNCIEDVAEYFNKYAFVYVGLYGYSYMEAGKNVMTLFDLRGFSVIISDQLVSSALNFMTLSVALISAGIGILINHSNPEWLREFSGSKNGPSFDINGNNTNLTMPAFLISFTVGIIICHTLMGVLDSAVNTVIVCFAEAPGEFEENHPEHSQRMRAAWLQVYQFEP